MKRKRPDRTGSTQVADAIRQVTAKMQQDLDAGWRSVRIDANDLLDVLLDIADRLDPPVNKQGNP